MKQRLLLFFGLGIVVGIAVAETYYIIATPLVLPDGSIDVVTDREYFGATAQILGSARKSIHIIMFSMQHYTDPRYADSHVNGLIKALIAAKSRGVEVRVVLDDWQKGNNATLRHLIERGIEARMIRDFDGSTHCKLIIVDGEVVIVGSTNWSYYAIDKNHEANVVINSVDIAGRFEAYFQTIWAAGS